MLHSNGGPDGNRLLESLLSRWDGFLSDQGIGFLYLLQIEVKEIPLLKNLSESALTGRRVEMSPAQTEAIPMELFRDAYRDLFPQNKEEIGVWHSELMSRFGPDLSLRHYFAFVAPKGDSPSTCSTNLSWIERFGSHLVTNFPAQEIAKARIAENLL